MIAHILPCHIEAAIIYGTLDLFILVPVVWRVFRGRWL